MKDNNLLVLNTSQNLPLTNPLSKKDFGGLRPKERLTNIRHFTDDGVRGTTFKRPGLDAMLEEIRAGNVAKIGRAHV